jgi:hypothetical protein
MKSYNFPKVQPTPLVVEGLVSRARPHFPNACSKGVCLRPGRLHILATSPSNASHVVKREISLAVVAMSVNVPGGNSDLNLDVRVKLQIFREVLHALGKVF